MEQTALPTCWRLAQPLLFPAREVATMFPSALAMPAPLPFVFDLTLTFGPVLLVIVLAVLDISAVALLRAALNANRSRIAGSSASTGPTVIPLHSGGPAEKRQAAPSRAA